MGPFFATGRTAFPSLLSVFLSSVALLMCFSSPPSVLHLIYFIGMWPVHCLEAFKAPKLHLRSPDLPTSDSWLICAMTPTLVPSTLSSMPVQGCILSIEHCFSSRNHFIGTQSLLKESPTTSSHDFFSSGQLTSHSCSILCSLALSQITPLLYVPELPPLETETLRFSRSGKNCQMGSFIQDQSS
jgi:hypothetical protein